MKPEVDAGFHSVSDITNSEVDSGSYSGTISLSKIWVPLLGTKANPTVPLCHI
jgi:hypothetical protein